MGHRARCYLLTALWFNEALPRSNPPLNSASSHARSSLIVPSPGHVFTARLLARSVEQREAVIKRFRLGQLWVLVCTDLMGRGVDFKGVNMVSAQLRIAATRRSTHLDGTVGNSRREPALLA